MALCPICGGEARGLAFPYQTTWNGKRYDWLGCRKCGSTTVDPVPLPQELEVIYAWENYHSRHYAEVDETRYQRSLSILAHHRPTRARLLDFGCGSGGYLMAARNAGYVCQGVEYEAKTIEKAAEQSGVPVSSLQALERDSQQFDIIHMLDVLPHLPDPVAMMRRLERLLAPEGIFFIEGPLRNNASLIYYTARAGKALRRRLGLDAPAAGAPTILVRLNRRAQREFFTRRLAYREIYFEVYETGWPYYIPGRALDSFGTRVKQIIGSMAIALSMIQKGPYRRFGNQFYGLFEPAERS